jgi:hypothetical protein
VVVDNGGNREHSSFRAENCSRKKRKARGSPGLFHFCTPKRMSRAKPAQAAMESFLPFAPGAATDFGKFNKHPLRGTMPTTGTRKVP